MGNTWLKGIALSLALAFFAMLALATPASAGSTDIPMRKSFGLGTQYVKIGATGFHPYFQVPVSQTIPTRIGFTVSNRAPGKSYTMLVTCKSISASTGKRQWPKSVTKVKEGKETRISIGYPSLRDGIVLKIRFQSSTGKKSSVLSYVVSNGLIVGTIPGGKAVERTMYNGAMSIPWICQNKGVYSPRARRWLYTSIPDVVITRDAAGTPHSISTDGCGQCCAAMALSYCTGKLVLPDEILRHQEFVKNGIGQYQFDCTIALAEVYDVHVSPTPYKADVDNALRIGHPVMVLVAERSLNGRKTDGHYYLLSGITKDGRYYVMDPYAPKGIKSDYGASYVTKKRSDRSYQESEYKGLYRQTFDWEEITSHRISRFMIFW